MTARISPERTSITGTVEALPPVLTHNSFISKFSQLIEANYPERICNILILNPNWLFNTLFSIVKPFMDPATVKKVSLDASNYLPPEIKLIDGDLKPALLEYFDEKNLWCRYGGTHQCEGLDNSPYRG